jgi:hypothetical protein
LESLVAELVGFRRLAKLGQAVGERGRGVGVSQHADRCLPCGQFNGEPRLVGIGPPEVLVVKRPGRRAAEDTDPEDCQDPDGIAIGDPGVLQRAAALSAASSSGKTAVRVAISHRCVPSAAFAGTRMLEQTMQASEPSHIVPFG